MPNKTVKLTGKLKQTSDGFVYLDVPDEILHGFYTILSGDVKKPPYFSKKFNKVGAHISVTNTDELGGQTVSEIGDEIEYTLYRMEQVNPDGWDEMKQVYFISVKSPELENLRQKYGLAKKKNGHEFHITIAVEPKTTTESSHRLQSLYEEAPEGVAFRSSKNLGLKISKAMGLALFGKKSFARDTQKTRRKRLGQAYPSGPRINTSPVPNKPRHRKFFGLDKPQIPY